MKSFSFSIITPEGIVVSSEAEVVEVRSTLGTLDVMAGHQPLVADCPAGRVRVLMDGKWCSYDCDSGIFTMDGMAAQVLTAFAKISE